ncbi:MAG: hydroxyacid dehydrogenase [Clostridiales bacterium]|nr:hydroxyacid dehydrogenase [Clostridiales bacterium]
MKIVVLANQDRQSQIFKKENIDSMRAFGDVVICKTVDGPDEQTVMELIKDADIAISSWNCPKMTLSILENAPGLKLLLHAAGSVKGIVSDELWARGIRVSGAAAALAKGVAETALGLTISSLKNFWNLSNVTRYGGWNDQNDTVREIYDVTVGVIGAGYAGRHYIKLLRNFDVEILLFDPTLDEDECKMMGTKKVELFNLMKDSDVVSVHAPSIPATHHLINAENLATMKDRAILINTARGTIIDEAALIAELKLGRISACIDVTDPEPPAESNELRSLPNVILTPHIAGSVNNGKKRIGDLIISELESYLKNGTLNYEIRPENLPNLA